MSPLSRILLPLLAFGFAATGMAADGRWAVQYYHDEDRTELNLTDIQFRSPRRGIALGSLREGRSADTVALVTSDGGAHWQMVKLKEDPVSLYMLNDTVGWLVTGKGIWRTDESGRTWKKISSEKGLLTVHFTDESRGWAAGIEKRVLSTTDGGKTWTPVAEAASLPGNPLRSVFDVIEFVTPQTGMIVGWNRPQTEWTPRVPGWVDPEKASRRKEMPHLVLSLATEDGGKTWKGSSASLFGQITRMRMGADRIDIALLEFRRSFAFRAEVMMINGQTAQSESVFRQKDRAITDVVRLKDKVLVAAGVEASGTLADSPVASKVHFLQTSNFKDWKEMPVDYRAVAHRVALATDGSGGLWAATDTGMILHWTGAQPGI